MAGRRAASCALQRRITTVELTNYTHDELIEILVNKGIDQDDACDMVEAYEKQRNVAITQHLNPVPCFRNLMSLAMKKIEHSDEPLSIDASESLGNSDEFRMPGSSM